MLTASPVSMPGSIQQLLKNAGPVTRRLALREAMTYLAASNRKRIRSNVSPDGSSMLARKKGSQRMFTKIAKQLKRFQRGDNGELGFFGRTGWVAANHQYGRTVKTPRYDIDMPVRELLGISDEDAQAIQAIFMKHLMKGMA